MDQVKEDLLDLIAGAQSHRLNEQRAPWSVLPGLTRGKQPEILQRLSVATTDKDSLPDDSFFEQLMKMQGTRIEDQRSSLPNGDTEQPEVSMVMEPGAPVAGGGDRGPGPGLGPPAQRLGAHVQGNGGQAPGVGPGPGGPALAPTMP